ncbi:ribokinase [Franzmannia pantelleriensis]|uniref:Ribokinase n=1 Tax=Franzmannia pantelleriensis TaxID=48727 RepID=A0A1G9F613_9GAMM|nr:ribokinase [Halomonas pantelleriensis]SDK83791.1 ribokinase [Halomonas pantelleriensis]
MPRPVYNFGSINIDHVYRVPHLVRPGETLASRSFQQVLGGKGANQSLAMARAGGRIEHWGRLGQADAWALQILSQAGVGLDDTELHDEPSGHALIQVDDQGENAIILHPGANHGFSDAAIEALLAKAQPGDSLLLQNECNGLDHLMRSAAQAGLEIAFNPAPMNAAAAALPLSACQLLFVNRGEAAALVDLPESSSPRHLLEALAQRLPDTELVLTLGGDGVCYHSEHHQLMLPAQRVKAVDTTAAGDTFIGYFMAARQAGEAVIACLQRASTASALCVQREGAAPSIPLASEVEAALRDWPTLAVAPY